MPTDVTQAAPRTVKKCQQETLQELRKSTRVGDGSWADGRFTWTPDDGCPGMSQRENGVLVSAGRASKYWQNTVEEEG